MPDGVQASREASERPSGMGKLRWIVAAGALFVAGAAFYLLMNTDAGDRPALDDIDAESREAMDELLREVD